MYPVTVDDYELVEVVGKGASATVSILLQLVASKLKQSFHTFSASLRFKCATMLHCSRGIWCHASKPSPQQIATHCPHTPCHAQGLGCICNAGLAGQVHSSEQDGGYQAHGPGELWRQLGECCCASATCSYLKLHSTSPCQADITNSSSQILNALLFSPVLYDNASINILCVQRVALHAILWAAVLA